MTVTPMTPDKNQTDALTLAERIPLHVTALAHSGMNLSFKRWNEISGDILKMAEALRSSTATGGREADGWQYRTRIDDWGPWRSIAEPLDSFKKRNADCIGKCIIELRPVYAILPVRGSHGWVRSKHTDGPNECGYYTAGIDIPTPQAFDKTAIHYHAIEFNSKDKATAEARRDLVLSLNLTPASGAVGMREATSSIEYQQKRGVAWDIVDEALLAYNDYMLDDDYNATAALNKIMQQMDTRRSFYHDGKPVLTPLVLGGDDIQTKSHNKSSGHALGSNAKSGDETRPVTVETIAREFRRAMSENPTQESFNKRAEEIERIADEYAKLFLSDYDVRRKTQPVLSGHDGSEAKSGDDATTQQFSASEWKAWAAQRQADNPIIKYTREALRQFRADPPDSDTQEAYLDAIVNFAIEACGIPIDDEDLAWITLGSTLPPQQPRQAKRAFQVIKGGKDAPTHPTDNASADPSEEVKL